MWSYDELGIRRPRVLSSKVMMQYMVDTGASVSVAGMTFARQLGVREDDLVQTNQVITSADGSQMKVLRVVFVSVGAMGNLTKEMVYVCRGTRGCLLSLNVCVNLGIVPESFPSLGTGRGTCNGVKTKDEGQTDTSETKDGSGGSTG